MYEGLARQYTCEFDFIQRGRLPVPCSLKHGYAFIERLLLLTSALHTICLRPLQGSLSIVKLVIYMAADYRSQKAYGSMHNQRF